MNPCFCPEPDPVEIHSPQSVTGTPAITPDEARPASDDTHDPITFKGGDTLKPTKGIGVEHAVNHAWQDEATSVTSTDAQAQADAGNGADKEGIKPENREGSQGSGVAVSPTSQFKCRKCGGAANAPVKAEKKRKVKAA